MGWGAPRLHVRLHADIKRLERRIEGIKKLQAAFEARRAGDARVLQSGGSDQKRLRRPRR
jgi:hypothetical protein